jgi:hypothetical protein
MQGFRMDGSLRAVVWGFALNVVRTRAHGVCTPTRLMGPFSDQVRDHSAAAIARLVQLSYTPGRVQQH